MPLPKNHAKTNATQDSGLITQQELDNRITLYKTKDELAQKVLGAKTPKQYKELIDSCDLNNDGSILLELLASDNSRTTILQSVRLSTSDYLKLKKLQTMDIELKELLSSAIEQVFSAKVNK